MQANALSELPIHPSDVDHSAQRILNAWPHSSVLHLRPRDSIPGDVREFYEELLFRAGKPLSLAEDARIGCRDAQRTGQIWMEVRFDPSLPNCFRHSKDAQPLHTDGSYIAEFPNAAFLCCVTQAAEGGETVFLAAADLLDALRAEDPDLLHALLEIPVSHGRSGDSKVSTVIRRTPELALNWNYYCVTDTGEFYSKWRERLFQFLSHSPRVRAALHEIRLKPGEALLWKDSAVLHGRNAFSASDSGDRFLWKSLVQINEIHPT